MEKIKWLSPRIEPRWTPVGSGYFLVVSASPLLLLISPYLRNWLWSGRCLYTCLNNYYYITNGEVVLDSVQIDDWYFIMYSNIVIWELNMLHVATIYRTNFYRASCTHKRVCPCPGWRDHGGNLCVNVRGLCRPGHAEVSRVVLAAITSSSAIHFWDNAQHFLHYEAVCLIITCRFTVDSG